MSEWPGLLHVTGQNSFYSKDVDSSGTWSESAKLNQVIVNAGNRGGGEERRTEEVVGRRSSLK